MRYAGITLLPVDKVVETAVTKYTVLEYPRLDRSDISVGGRGATRLSCELAVDDLATRDALLMLSALKSKNDLYIDDSAVDSHQFQDVVLDVTRQRILIPGKAWVLEATLLALDPHKYDAVTGEVVY